MTFWEQLDQAPVSLKHWIVDLLPKWLQIPASILISISAIIGVFALLFAFITWLERRGLGRMQNRQGPNRVGPFGLFQPIADGIKMIIKEDLVPDNADKILHFLAPVALIVPSLLALSMIPVGRNIVAIDFAAGVLLFFAIGASTELSVFMAGWGSHNKYSLLGSLRAIAQMVSYELPLVISALAVIFVTGTMSTTKIVEMQTNNFLHWYILSPWGMLGFVTFLICALAESNRSPFDLPEAESELIAGHLTEYSGFKYALFFMAEYFGMMGISGMAITLFLGGWQAPLPMLDFVPSWFWFFSKLFALIWIFIWVRATLPRLRADQLMDLAWKFFLPLGLLNLVCAGIWAKAGPLWGWGMGLALLIPSIFGLGRLLRGIRPAGGRRVYQFAD
jgi:NADH-quinone oxidoreductase subunit H